MAEGLDSLAILLLAAGTSTRMRGSDKLLQVVGGQPVLRRQAQAALATGASVVVALPTDRPARLAALQGLSVQKVRVADAREGMAASIRAGVAALPEGVAGVAILPADMPEITARDLATVLTAFRAHGDRIVRGAAQSGAAGHPVVFPARLFAALLALKGDQGARQVLRGEDIVSVPLPGTHALTDLDTPEAWAAWLAARQP